MARSDIQTHLSLDRWAEIIGLDGRHFNQIVTAAKPNTSCTVVWKQFAWQENHQLSREDVALAIQTAEGLIEDQVGYHLLPTWEVDERIAMTKAAIPEVINVSLLTARRFPTTFRVRRGHIISGGIETKNLVEAGAVVVYTDDDGDGYPEVATITATIPASVTLTDPDEVAVFVSGEGGHNDWEIRPLKSPVSRRRSVTISGSTITIVMQRELLADPDLTLALNPTAIDGNDDTQFSSTVDVYQRRNDPQQMATLMWAPREGDLCNCADSSCVTCAQSLGVGCLVANNFRQGIFSVNPASFASATETFTAAEPTVRRAPDNLRVWYYSGFQDKGADAPTLEMEGQWERAVTYLSMTYLTRFLCECQNVQNFVRRMTEDVGAVVATGTSASSFRISDRTLNNPWGTMRGAILAWQIANGTGGRTIGQAVAL